MSCIICHQTIIKYKCPKCKARSCSLPCFKSHEESCISSKPAQFAQKPPEETKNHLQDPGRLPAESNVESLFRHYPGLKEKLRQIYLSTLEPSPDSPTANRAHREPRSDRNRYTEQRWTPEKGFDTGLARLNEAMHNSKESEVEAITAFIDLVTGHQSSKSAF